MGWQPSDAVRFIRKLLASIWLVRSEQRQHVDRDLLQGYVPKAADGPCPGVRHYIRTANLNCQQSHM